MRWPRALKHWNFQDFSLVRFFSSWKRNEQPTKPDYLTKKDLAIWPHDFGFKK
jgi:hypothetical protein